MDETHPLALSVINDGKTYAERCAKHKTMKSSQYAGYIKALVAKQAHLEHVRFGSRHKPADIEHAAHDVVEHMNRHMSEMEVPSDQV